MFLNTSTSRFGSSVWFASGLQEETGAPEDPASAYPASMRAIAARATMGAAGMRSLQDDQSFLFCHHQVWRPHGRSKFDLLEPPGCASDQIRDTIALSSQVAQSAFQAADRNGSFFVRTAQAILATLLAQATTILFVCNPRSTKRSMNCVIRLSRLARWWKADRMP